MSSMWIMMIAYDTWGLKGAVTGSRSTYSEDPVTWRKHIPATWAPVHRYKKALAPAVEPRGCVLVAHLTFGSLYLSDEYVCLADPVPLKRKQAYAYEIVNVWCLHDYVNWSMIWYMIFVWNVYLIIDTCSYMRSSHVCYLLCVGFSHWALSSPHHSVLLVWVTGTHWWIGWCCNFPLPRCRAL